MHFKYHFLYRQFVAAALWCLLGSAYAQPAASFADVASVGSVSGLLPLRLQMATSLSLSPSRVAKATAAPEVLPSLPLRLQSAAVLKMPVVNRVASGVAASAPVNTFTLTQLLNQAALAHPAIQAARLDTRASAEDLRAIERQRWPTMSAIVENRSTNPSVVATRALRLEQNLWDGGRVSARIREAEANISVNEARVYIQNQNLSMQIVNAWQNLLSADGRISVARDTLLQLGAYREQMTRRVTADVSPPIDLELVQSRILQTEVELTQAINARLVSLSKLEQYSGIETLRQPGQQPAAAPGLLVTAPVAQLFEQTNWLDVASLHPDVRKARQDVVVAQERMNVKRAEQWPQVYARVDQPMGAVNNSMVAFMGLRYTPGAGLSTALEAQALSSRAASQEQAIDAAMRTVLETLYADRDEFNSSRSRMQALDKAVVGSRGVLESYGRQFTAGRKTWQDLMNAVRELAQNQYNLADAHAAMVGAMYRLQIRTGQSPYPAQ